MIWPFRRKKPRVVIDRREGGWQWKAGMLARCVSDSWRDPGPAPEIGDVVRVTKVEDLVNHRNVRAFFLWFEGYPDIGYGSTAFRPLNIVNSGEEIETGLIAKIKRSAKRGAPVGEPVT
jgi:hypothetical protein